MSLILLGRKGSSSALQATLASMLTVLAWMLGRRTRRLRRSVRRLLIML